MKKNIITILVVMCIPFLSACAQGPSYVEDYSDNKINLKAYFPAGSVFHLDSLFNKGEEDNYDLKIKSFFEHETKENYKKTNGKEGNYYTDSSYDVQATYNVIITDISGNEILKEKYNSHANNVECSAFGLKKNVSEERAKRNCINEGLEHIRNKISAQIIYSVSKNESIRKLESTGGLVFNKDKFKKTFENIEFVVSDQLKRGFADEKLDAYVNELAHDIFKKSKKYFINSKIVSNYSSVNPNQIIVQPKSINIKESNSDDAYYGRGGYVIIETEIEVITFNSEKTFKFEGVGSVEESILTLIPQQLLGVATLGAYSKAQAGAYKHLSSRKARSIVSSELINSIVFSPEYQTYSEKSFFNGTSASDVKTVSSKIPFSLLLSFPPDIEKVIAEGQIYRSIVINGERLGGTISAPIGKILKEKISEELSRRFEVTESVGESQGGGYDPLDLACIVEFKIDDVALTKSSDQSKSPDPLISLWGSMNVKSITGDIFKIVDFSSSGKISEVKDDSVFNSTIGGILISNPLTQGFMYKRQFTKGVEQLVDQIIEKIMSEFDMNGFVEDFSAFSKYSFVKNTNSINEMRNYLVNNEKSKYYSEIFILKRKTMETMAFESNNIEIFLDYINDYDDYFENLFFMEKYQDILAAQIISGSKVWCEEYFDIFRASEKYPKLNSVCN